ncbi:MAG TPA: CHAD domain-containing protein [Actinospica sp.]|jgi:CHAD domain-containing protein|nr:CHAD domain-containing protein [Actinospica sp.]
MDPTAGDVLRAYLAEQSNAFLAQLPRLRQDKPEAAHKLRVACRRTRSVLRTFRPLLDEQWADGLSGQIAALTDVIAPERDIEVVRERLLGELEHYGTEEPGVLRAHTLLDRMLARDYAAAHDTTLATLAGPAFHALADRIALAPQAVATPAKGPLAQSAECVLPPLVRAEFAQVVKRSAAVDQQGPDDPWHRLRISAKRTRYAAEVCVPVIGIPAEAFAAQLGRLTEELGRQQDAAVAGETVLRAAQSPRIATSTGFVLGRLLGETRAEIARSRRSFPELWSSATAPSYRAWFAEEVR